MLCESLSYPAAIKEVNTLLFIFFGDAGHFDMRLAPSLADFCLHARVTIPIVFRNLRADTREPLQQVMDMMTDRLAAALIYAFYQNGKPNSIRMTFSCKKATQTQESKKNINKVLTASTRRNYSDLDQAFQDLVLPPETTDIISHAMGLYNYVSIRNGDEEVEEKEEKLNA